MFLFVLISIQSGHKGRLFLILIDVVLNLLVVWLQIRTLSKNQEAAMLQIKSFYANSVYEC